MKRTFEEKCILFFNDFFEQISEIKIVKPFFWTKCCKCKNEFRNEDMFQLKYPIYFGLIKFKNSYIHGCKECFKEKKGFINFISINNFSSIKNEYFKLLHKWEMTPTKEWVNLFRDILVAKNSEKENI